MTTETNDQTPTQERPGLLLSSTELQLTRIAVERLAADYGSQGEDKARGRTLDLLRRLTDHGEGKAGMNLEQGQAFQKAFMDAAAQGKGTEGILREWWEVVLRQEADPAAKLAPMLVYLIHQASSQASSQSAVPVLQAICKKLEAIEKRVGGAPAVNELGAFLVDGLKQAQAGNPLWPDDPERA